MRFFLVVAVLAPSIAFGMDRAAMDQLLALSRSKPDSAEFREALVKQLGDVPIKNGEAFNSNGPDFIWAVEAAKTPTIVVDDQPAPPMRVRMSWPKWRKSPPAPAPHGLFDLT